MTIRNATSITVLATGGTIDKEYNFDSEMVIGEPFIRSILERVITEVSFDIRSVLKLDSLDMTDADRDVLVSAVNAVEGDRILITHGTDTMPETARYLLEHASIEGKTIVLCGSIQPAIMRHSDADFNVGAAVAALNLLEPGVYVSMSGQIFDGATVRKDRSRGLFVER
ncbi:asparaginase domain-containing protein [Rothia aerolata]|nr:asparaginase domain-containing protein [Rothia aerolata]